MLADIGFKLISFQFRSWIKYSFRIELKLYAKLQHFLTLKENNEKFDLDMLRALQRRLSDNGPAMLTNFFDTYILDYKRLNFFVVFPICQDWILSFTYWICGSFRDCLIQLLFIAVVSLSTARSFFKKNSYFRSHFSFYVNKYFHVWFVMSFTVSERMSNPFSQWIRQYSDYG